MDRKKRNLSQTKRDRLALINIYRKIFLFVDQSIDQTSNFNFIEGHSDIFCNFILKFKKNVGISNGMEL